MKTSLNELKQIDDYIMHKMNAEEVCLFQARLILQAELKEQLFWQQRSYEIIRQYGRRQLKLEIEQLHDKIFQSTEYEGFRNKVLRLFQKDR